jgi:hypothetical protein
VAARTAPLFSIRTGNHMVIAHYDFGIPSFPMAAIVIDDFGTEWELLPADAPRCLLKWPTIFAALDFLYSEEVH